MNSDQAFLKVLDEYIAAERDERPAMDSVQWLDLWSISNLQINKFFDDIALRLAARFHDKSLSFEFCDWIINDLWHAACQALLKKKLESLGTFYEVYEAFDSGECHHPNDDDSVDAVEKYTRPAIAEILIRNAT